MVKGKNPRHSRRVKLNMVREDKKWLLKGKSQPNLKMPTDSSKHLSKNFERKTTEVGDEVKSMTVKRVKKNSAKEEERTVSGITFSQTLFKSHGSSHFLTSLKPFEMLQARSAIHLFLPFPCLSNYSVIFFTLKKSS